jgi:formylglycine-generating enzyme required for sulfatase activity/serine/threonine protein phosphatase PrpC
MSKGTPVRSNATRTVWSRQSWRWRGGLTAGYASEAGNHHASNQDSCTHAPSSERPGFCGVADGVGGGAHGEIASSVLLSHCAEAPKATYRDPDRLVDWVIQADARVAEAIARRTRQAGAATLAAAWFPSEDTAHLVSVGDCRVYRLSPARQRYSIRRVTQDQTYANVAEAPPPNGRPNDPARMVGAGAVGVPSVVKTPIREGELLLLCSDGVHKFVPDDQIANIVADGLGEGRSLETICGALVRTAKSNGGHDDASALLVLRRPWLAARWAFFAVAALLLLTLGAQTALAETQSVIDPTEAAEPQPPPTADAPARKARKPAPTQPDPALKRERQRAEEEVRKRATAEARAQAAESEAAKLRAAGQQRQAEAAKEAAAAKAAAKRAAQERAAAARAASARATRERIAAEKLAADQAAAEAAARDAAARQAAERQAAAREAAAKEAIAREAAAKEAAAKEAAVKEAAAREAAAREAAAREMAARDAAARELAAKEAAVRAFAAKQIPSRDVPITLAAMRSPAKDFFTSRPLPQFGTAFRDCAECPDLVWLPQGEFLMGEPNGANGRHLVRIGYVLAVGRFEVTFAEWDACVAGGGCRRRPDDAGWGRGRQPVVNVSWEDAQQYVAWIARKTRKNYRLLSEAEWEYAARAGSHVRFWWGNDAGQGDANCNGCGSHWDGRRAAPVGSFAPNPFGLHDMHGNVSEWVEDCYHDRYQEAPGDGRAWTNACTTAVDIRMVRGGAWRDASNAVRSAARWSASRGYYDNRIGFRIARTE